MQFKFHELDVKICEECFLNLTNLIKRTCRTHFYETFQFQNTLPRHPKYKFLLITGGINFLSHLKLCRAVPFID